jgi:hypothetical protein
MDAGVIGNSPRPSAQKSVKAESRVHPRFRLDEKHGHRPVETLVDDVALAATFHGALFTEGELTGQSFTAGQTRYRGFSLSLPFQGCARPHAPGNGRGNRRFVADRS